MVWFFLFDHSNKNFLLFVIGLYFNSHHPKQKQLCIYLKKNKFFMINTNCYLCIVTEWPSMEHMCYIFFNLMHNTIPCKTKDCVIIFSLLKIRLRNICFSFTKSHVGNEFICTINFLTSLECFIFIKLSISSLTF